MSTILPVARTFRSDQSPIPTYFLSVNCCVCIIDDLYRFFPLEFSTFITELFEEAHDAPQHEILHSTLPTVVNYWLE